MWLLSSVIIKSSNWKPPMSVNLKRDFWCLQFFQKMNLKISISALFFVRFLEELKTPKSPFKINWPLALYSKPPYIWLRQTLWFRYHTSILGAFWSSAALLRLSSMMSCLLVWLPLLALCRNYRLWSMWGTMISNPIWIRSQK